MHFLKLKVKIIDLDTVRLVEDGLLLYLAIDSGRFKKDT